MRQQPSLLPAAALVALGSACEPLATSFEPEMELLGHPYEQEAATFAEPPADPDSLRILTYNIKFGGARIDFFFDGHDDIVHMDEATVHTNLDAVAALIREQDPDILLAQEVDMRSKRSAYVDQMAYLLEHTDLNYGVFVPNWQSRFVAEEGLGPIMAGQAVLSKYPLVGNTRIDLPQPTTNAAYINYFYLRRAVQITTAQIPGGELVIVNNHPEAYAEDGTRAVHLEMIYDAGVAREGTRILTGGDFNVPPPGTKKLRDFPDYVDANTSGVSETVFTAAELEAMRPFFDRYNTELDLAAYEAMTEEEQAELYSHSIDGDTGFVMRLDYLFTDLPVSGGGVIGRPGDGDPPTAFDPNLLSDHAPVWSVVEWP